MGKRRHPKTKRLMITAVLASASGQGDEHTDLYLRRQANRSRIVTVGCPGVQRANS